MIGIVEADFLHSLITWMVGNAAAFTPAVTLAYASTPRQIWRQQANESATADPYAVLRTYPGPPLAWHPLSLMNLQVQTTASQDAGREAGLELAWQLYQTLVASDGKPVRMATINGFKAADNSADGTYLLHHLDPLQRPGGTGVDDRGRSLAGFNMEVGFYRTS
jgi:hypothetical protein